jgi:hypothetical protein
MNTAQDNIDNLNKKYDDEVMKFKDNATKDAAKSF